MNSKKFYSFYQADDSMKELNIEVQKLIFAEKPGHVFEFGCGTGKNLEYFKDNGIVTCGLDISPINVMTSHLRHRLPFVIIGDESHLGHLQYFDTVFTISVLDHIPLITKIISEFKRIARKSVYLAETNDEINEHYFAHNYESFDFERLDFEWKGDDTAKYNIYKWSK